MEDSLRLDCATRNGVDLTTRSTKKKSHSRRKKHRKTGCLRRVCRQTVTPQRISEKGTRLPRQSVRNEAATSHPSWSTGTANSYTVHSFLQHPTLCTERKNHHGVRNLSAARRLAASGAGSQSNRTSKHVASSRVGALCQGLAGVFVCGFGDPFGMNCTGSNNDRSYAVTT